MNSKELRRRAITIANSRWTTYAVAGAASSLAVATAEADIHYSGPVNYRFAGSTQHNFPLDNGASLSFLRIDEAAGQGYGHLRIPDPAGGLFQSIGDFAGDGVGSSESGLYLSRLRGHLQVSQLRLGNSCRSTTFSNFQCYGGIIGLEGGSGGHFQQPGVGFIAFLFNAGAGNEFGWARIKTTGAPGYKFVVLDYAWADPGTPINTGQTRTHGTADAASKSGSLGLLATGATGLKAWRAHKHTAAPN
ncbi:MAG TPA: hypothetical protein VGI60_09900 [Chthoniobacterales bacterium]|jgi:hypothetical protein